MQTYTACKRLEVGDLPPIYIYVLQDEESSYVMDLAFYDGPIEYHQLGNKKKAASFFSCLMRERLLKHDYGSVAELKKAVIGYVKFFNEKRISTVLRMTPEEKLEELKKHRPSK